MSISKYSSNCTVGGVNPPFSTQHLRCPLASKLVHVETQKPLPWPRPQLLGSPQALNEKAKALEPRVKASFFSTRVRVEFAKA